MPHRKDKVLRDKEKKEIRGNIERQGERASACPFPACAGQWGYNRFLGYALRGLHISQASCQKN